eukprot:570656-Amphidinium_carterae.1
MTGVMHYTWHSMTLLPLEQVCSLDVGVAPLVTGGLVNPMAAIALGADCAESHIKHIRVLFGDMDNVLLFPNSVGENCTKTAIADTVARLAGLTLEDDMGRSRFTGHSLRVTVAQHLASVGLPLHF